MLIVLSITLIASNSGYAVSNMQTSNITNSSLKQTTFSSNHSNTSSYNTISTNGTIKSGNSSVSYQAAGGETYTGTSSGTKFSVDTIITKGHVLRYYVQTNGKLPDYIYINRTKVSMSQFLELLTTALLQINSGNTNLITLKNFTKPTNPTENIHSGNIYKAEYFKIAQDVKNYMDSSGKTPDFAYNTTLGTYLRFENLVYMYSMILDYRYHSGNTADFAVMRPWDIITAPVITKYNISQIDNAASRVREYVETSHALPSYVTIGTKQVSMSQFLELLTTAILQINSRNNNLVDLKNYIDPSNPLDNIQTGTIYKAEYLKIAADIKNYMDSNGKAPNYAHNTSLGTYLGFQNLVYMYSMILDYHYHSGNMADWAAMKPWSVISGGSGIPSELEKYLVATSNCQVDDPSIKALAASLTAGQTTSYAKAVAIFNWVRDNIDYSFYYNTVKGAVGTLNSKTANCVDTAHLLIALERAAGIPARYEHGYCQFTSGNWYGHVWAQVWVDGKWYRADGTSSRNQFGVINNWNTDTATIYGTYISLPF